jgi:hypothetical protein
VEEEAAREWPRLAPNERGVPCAGEAVELLPKPRRRVILVEERLTGVPRKAVRMGGFFFSSVGRTGEAAAKVKRGLEH